jgi:hypothetical protein
MSTGKSFHLSVKEGPDRNGREVAVKLQEVERS